jgi:penicillin V acylase-like amidase (Ntn superfamily)
MFGLEDKENEEKKPAFTFDLETQLSDTKEQKKIIEKIEGKLQVIKNLLREGENKENYEKLGWILYGYLSIMKVSGRIKRKQ